MSLTGAVNSQVFLGTHSWECVGAAVDAFRIVPDEFRLHRLQWIGERLQTITYDHRVALAAVTDPVEVR